MSGWFPGRRMPEVQTAIINYGIVINYVNYLDRYPHHYDYIRDILRASESGGGGYTGRHDPQTYYVGGEQHEQRD